MLPKIGINIVPLAPNLINEAAVRAEARGYESVWSGEHVLVPVGAEQRHPGRVVFGPDSPFLEPFVALSNLAAVTRTLRLGIGVLILPLHDPFAVAKSLATVDVLSGGRMDLGIGVGWMNEEFEIIGHDFATRGRRADEMLLVIDKLLREDRPEFEGEFYRFGPLGFSPKPVQKPRPPIHVGGFAPVALRRAATLGDGYYGSLRRNQDISPTLNTLRTLRAEAGRADDPFEISLNSLGPPDRAALEGVAEEGVDRVVVTLWRLDGTPAIKGCAQPLDAIERFADQVGMD